MYNIKNISLFFFLFSFVFYSTVFCEENKEKKINEILKEMGTSIEQVLDSDEMEKYKNYQIPEEIKKQAEKDFNEVNPELQKKVKIYQKELKEKEFKHLIPKDMEKDDTENEKNSEFLLAEDEYIFILISSSVPRKTLANYIASVEKINNSNISLVLRGFINGMKKIKPTQDFITEIVIKDPSCKDAQGNLTKECEAYGSKVVIDPLIFRTFNVSKVPAIVYAKNLNLNDRNRSIGYPGNIKEGMEKYIIFGDISLDYALSRFYDETKDKKFLKLQEKLRKGFY